MVQRLIHLSVEYRTFSAGVWDWSSKKDDAHIFAMAALPAVRGSDDEERSAQAHIQALRAAGETSFLVAAVVEPQERRQRDLRRLAREDRMLASVREAEPIIPEPEFETGKRPPIRRAKPPVPRVAPDRAYEIMEREGLA